jgi:Tol biopolymer transport system component
MRVSLALHVFCAYALVALSCPAPAAEQPLSPAKALSYVRAGDLHFSPDGSELAYAATSYLWDARSHIAIVDIGTGRTREITPADKSERSPQWSPDGRSLVFLSNRGGKTQIYAVRGRDSEPASRTTRKFGVESFRWSPDGRNIAYLAKDDSAPDEDSGPQIADRESDLPRLWVLDFASGKQRKIGIPGMRIDGFDWQDGEHLLIDGTSTPQIDEFTDAIYSLSLRDGTVRPVAHPPQPFDSLIVSPDGKSFVVRATTGGGPMERDPLTGNANGGDLHPVEGIPDLAVAEIR